MDEDIKYQCIRTSEITDVEKDDFIDFSSKEFHVNFNSKWFNWKYLENIYGDSLIILAYDENKLVGIRSFWRNDVDGVLSYQACDTRVAEEYEDKGILEKMNELALENIGPGFIYNYPEESELSRDLKLGWEENKYYYLEFVLNKSRLKNKTKYISDDYLLWKFGESPMRKYFYYENRGENYLLYKRSDSIYYTFGRFNSEYTSCFTKAKPKILFNYTEEKTTLYKMIKNRGTILSFEKDDQNYSEVDIPIYKGDFF